MKSKERKRLHRGELFLFPFLATLNVAPERRRNYLYGKKKARYRFRSIGQDMSEVDHHKIILRATSTR